MAKVSTNTEELRADPEEDPTEDSISEEQESGKRAGRKSHLGRSGPATTLEPGLAPDMFLTTRSDVIAFLTAAHKQNGFHSPF